MRWGGFATWNMKAFAIKDPFYGWLCASRGNKRLCRHLNDIRKVLTTRWEVLARLGSDGGDGFSKHFLFLISLLEESTEC